MAAARASRTRSAALSARRQPRRHGPQPALRAPPTPLIAATAPEPRAGPRAAGMSCVEVSVPSAGPGEAPVGPSDLFRGDFARLPRSSGWQMLEASGPQRAGRLVTPPRATGAGMGR